jgi:hypothetical protein
LIHTVNQHETGGKFSLRQRILSLCFESSEEINTFTFKQFLNCLPEFKSCIPVPNRIDGIFWVKIANI